MISQKISEIYQKNLIQDTYTLFSYYTCIYVYMCVYENDNIMLLLLVLLLYILLFVT